MAHKRVSPGAAHKPSVVPSRGLAGRWFTASFGWFMVRVVLIWLVEYTLAAGFPSIVSTIREATIVSLVPVLGLALHGASRVGDVLQAAGTSIRIVPECTSAEPTMLLSGAILASATSASSRLWGVLVGATILWFYNLVRIMALVVVLARAPSMFDSVHVFLWQSVTIILIIGLYAGWLKFAGSRTSA